MAIALVVIGAAVKYMVWERHAANPWIAIRWVAIAALAVDVAYEIVVLEPALERARGDAELLPGLRERYGNY